MPRLRYLHEEGGWCTEEREWTVRENGRAYFVRSVFPPFYPDHPQPGLGKAVWIAGERSAGRRLVARSAGPPPVGAQVGLF